jgi:hypothetical protein
VTRLLALGSGLGLGNKNFQDNRIYAKVSWHNRFCIFQQTSFFRKNIMAE